MFRIQGKDAFDKEIENEAFTGSPIIAVTRITEENDVVLAEGSVRFQRKDGNFWTRYFATPLKWKMARSRSSPPT